MTTFLKVYPRPIEPVVFNHSEKCKAAQAEVEKFKADHPHYCHTCNGYGTVRSGGDLVPYGSTWVHLPEDCDPCDCVEHGRCPHCGRSISSRLKDNGDIESTFCVWCGWEEGNDGIPEVECDSGCTVTANGRTIGVWAFLEP